MGQGDLGLSSNKIDIAGPPETPDGPPSTFPADVMTNAGNASHPRFNPLSRSN
jgi:hypothetical protein